MVVPNCTALSKFGNLLLHGGAGLRDTSGRMFCEKLMEGFSALLLGRSAAVVRMSFEHGAIWIVILAGLHVGG
jgi:hypothetical protein